MTEMKRLGFHRAVIQCDKENIHSIRVAERNGFTFEELRLKDSIGKDGSRDTVIFVNKICGTKSWKKKL